MEYPYKYPEIYAELARQGKTKKALAQCLGLTLNGLRYKQSVGDFMNGEMQKVSEFLKKPTEYLFASGGYPPTN